VVVEAEQDFEVQVQQSASRAPYSALH